MSVLTERQHRILAGVVRDYIASATPVSSSSLSGQTGLEVSPATVRHEMAVLEEGGYLTHPHTSAGRIPTAQGYRYYVERLLEEPELSPDERRTIRHQFHQAPLELDQWLRLSAAILAHSTQNAALVTAPKAPRSRFKHLELVSMGERGVLAVLVLQEGILRQELLGGVPALEQEEWSRLAHQLTSRFYDRETGEIRTFLSELAPLPQTVAQHVIQSMEQVDSQASAELYQEGLLYILQQPEFAAREKIENILELLERRWVLESILAEAEHSRGDVQVLIGSRGRWPELRECSIVFAHYGATPSFDPQEQAIGRLAILGPMRMPYGRILSTVRYMSGLMSDLFSSWYG